MIEVKLEYYTLKEAAERWGRTEYKILEWGANGILKIHTASNLRLSRITSLSHYIKKPVHVIHLEKMLRQKRPIFAGNTRLAIKDLAITEEELHRFEQEQGFQTFTENDYPPELDIAVEVWDKVFSHGLTPQNPPLSQHDIVRDALKKYGLEEGPVERIRYILVTGAPTTPVTEPTTPEHNRNEPGHPHHAPLLEIAVAVWTACEKSGKTSPKSNEIKAVFSLINPKPGGGRT